MPSSWFHRHRWRAGSRPTRPYRWPRSSDGGTIGRSSASSSASPSSPRSSTPSPRRPSCATRPSTRGDRFPTDRAGIRHCGSCRLCGAGRHDDGAGRPSGPRFDHPSEPAQATPDPLPGEPGPTPGPNPPSTGGTTEPEFLTGYQWPLHGGRISSFFEDRTDGFVVIDGKRVHDGLDVATYCGDHVSAAHEGTVLEAGSTSIVRSVTTHRSTRSMLVSTGATRCGSCRSSWSSTTGTVIAACTCTWRG